MAFDVVDLGSSPDGAGGDTNRQAFTTVNENFARVPFRVEGVQVKLVYRNANARWELPDGAVPDLTARTASITWEGTSAQIPAQGTGDADFQVGDTALVRASTL